MHALRTVALSALLLTAALPARPEPYLQAEPREYGLEGASQLKVEFPVGTLSIEGDDGTTVRSLIRVDCREQDSHDCARQARRIRVDHHVSGGRLSIEVTGIRKDMGTPRVNVEMHLLVPRKLLSRLEMGVGKLAVTGMAADLEVELGVGELTVKGDQRDYTTVEAESGVGDATIRTRSGDIREKGFIGHTAHWTGGRGSGSLKAHVGVGQAEVTLR